MMTREELEAALDRFTINWHSGDFGLVAAAARKQLALMAEKCMICYGVYKPCDHCNSTGKVYPPETVKKIAKVIAEIGQLDEKAIAVLDALGESE